MALGNGFIFDPQAQIIRRTEATSRTTGGWHPNPDRRSHHDHGSIPHDGRPAANDGTTADDGAATNGPAAVRAGSTTIAALTRSAGSTSKRTTIGTMLNLPAELFANMR